MTDETIMNAAVALARAHGDAREDTYRLLGEHFLAAHRDVPDGLSIEVGTRRGGSAALQLALLHALYPDEPLFITVDPYGCKPYLSGTGVTEGLYGDAEYVAAKKLLAGYAHHVHFPVTSLDFMAMVSDGLRLWRRGKPVWIDDRSVTCVFLDGDHDQPTILAEVRGFGRMLDVGGRLVVDNVDTVKDLRFRVLGIAAAENMVELPCSVPDAIVLRRES